MFSLPGQRPRRENFTAPLFQGVWSSHEKQRRHHRQHLIKQQGPHCFLIASVTDLLSAVTHHGRTCPMAGYNRRKLQVPCGNTQLQQRVDLLKLAEFK